MASKAKKMQEKAMSHTSRVTKKTAKVSLVDTSHELDLDDDFQNPILSSCMAEVTDLICNREIPTAEYVSLLNDYVESEFFLIDGDSLFISCAMEITLQRGQNLHFFYLVERFLQDLTTKGAKYIIIFFKDAEYLYFRSPDLLSLRTALIIHLRKNTEAKIHTEFTSCLDPSWQNFLKHNYPYFLIISDEGLNELQTSFLYIFIMQTLSKGINVVLTSGQNSDAIRVYGYHIHSYFRHTLFFQKREAKVKHYYEALIQYLKEFNTKKCISLSGCPSLNILMAKVHTKLIKFQEETNNFRYAVCIITCSLALELHKQVLEGQNTSTKVNVNSVLTMEEAGDLMRMYCLSVVFLHHLPLSQRAQIRAIDVCWKKETLKLREQHKLCEFYVLQHLTNETSWNMDFSTLPDLSDNLLWKNIAFYYESEKGQGLA